MEDVLRWQNDIGMVLDNHVGCQYFLPDMIARSANSQELAGYLQEFYTDSIDRVLRDVPEDAVGHWLVREMCCNLPLYVFEGLAQQYWEDRV